jgi:predicted aspartyl protease
MLKLGLLSLAVLATGSAPALAGDTPPSAADLFASGDLDAAATAYQRVLAAQPSDPAATLNLGTIRLYRNDLAGAQPLLKAALAADPQNARATRLLAELDRRRAEAKRRSTIDGSEAVVPFVTESPLPVVRAIINDKPAILLVDTGADVALEPAFAQSVGLKLESAGNGTFAGGEQAALQSGMLVSMSLGSATADDVPVHVFPSHSGALFPHTKIDGVVGTTYFERFLVTLDFPHNRMILRPRSTAVSAAFQRAAVAGGAAVVPCLLVGDHFVVARAQVNDAPAGQFLFDSGLAGGGLMPSKALLAAAHISLDTSQAQSGMGAAGAVTAIPFVAKRVAVGSAVQTGVRGIYTPEGTPLGIFPFTVWGVVSNDFLEHYVYTVDFDAMTIVLATQSP